MTQKYKGFEKLECMKSEKGLPAHLGMSLSQSGFNTLHDWYTKRREIKELQAFNEYIRAGYDGGLLGFLEDQFPGQLI